jgi:hypothetical protein
MMSLTIRGGLTARLESRAADVHANLGDRISRSAMPAAVMVAVMIIIVVVIVTAAITVIVIAGALSRVLVEPVHHDAGDLLGV